MPKLDTNAPRTPPRRSARKSKVESPKSTKKELKTIFQDLKRTSLKDDDEKQIKKLKSTEKQSVDKKFDIAAFHKKLKQNFPHGFPKQDDKIVSKSKTPTKKVQRPIHFIKKAIKNPTKPPTQSQKTKSKPPTKNHLLRQIDHKFAQLQDQLTESTKKRILKIQERESLREKDGSISENLMIKTQKLNNKIVRIYLKEIQVLEGEIVRLEGMRKMIEKEFQHFDEQRKVQFFANFISIVFKTFHLFSIF